jgi:uncharacterized protein (TIGR03437 family)
MRCCLLSVFFLGSLALQGSQQAITPAPQGPFHVAGNRIVDARGQTFLMRGTQLTDFRLETASRDILPASFGAHSATSLSAIRLRFNMNTVRVLVNGLEAGQPGYFIQLAKLVKLANQTDLLVVLASQDSGDFWSRCAAQFRNYPNVMFDAPAEMVPAIRAAGATQPIVVASQALLADSNIIYEAFPRIGAADLDTQFGSLADRVPMMATGWDPQIEDAAKCAAFPSNPTAATALVESYLNYFDVHQISWSVSTYEPGKLIKEYSLQDATSLENGWTCGQRGLAGMGRVVESHLRSAEERGLSVVSAGGGVDVPRGGYAIAYGKVMAERDAYAGGVQLPLTLGRIRVDVTDAAGVTRPAGILFASEGWGQVNFVVPQDSAVGPARMILAREDGSRTEANIIIADTAPGLWTGVSCRGPAQGTATQVFADGRKPISPLSMCKGSLCQTVPIPTATGSTTRIVMRGSGFRNAGSAAKIEVTVGGFRVPVVEYGPAPEPGVDTITIEIPSSLKGLGETELLCHIGGRVSNAVQVRIGGGKPVS